MKAFYPAVTQLPKTTFRRSLSSPLSDVSQHSYYNDPTVATRALCSRNAGCWWCLFDFQYMDVSVQQVGGKSAEWNSPVKERKALCIEYCKTNQEES